MTQLMYEFVHTDTSFERISIENPTNSDLFKAPKHFHSNSLPWLCSHAQRTTHKLKTLITKSATVADAFKKYLDFMLILRFASVFLCSELNDVHKNFMHHYHRVAGETFERKYGLHGRNYIFALCLCNCMSFLGFCDDSQQRKRSKKVRVLISVSANK